MRLSAWETIINEQKFLEANEARSKGPPGSLETKAAIDRLRRYREAKGQLIPIEISKSINNFIDEISNQESKD